MTVFYTWAFPALDAPTSRTLAERLSDVVNVRDWGAVGDNVTDDTDEIQAAIDYCMGTVGGPTGSKTAGGIVFFPPGLYKVTSLTVGSSDPTAMVQLMGSGGNYGNCRIVGNYAGGFVISQGAAVYDNIGRIQDIGVINNNSTAGTGAIRVTGTGVSISSCTMTGMVLVDASEANGCTIMNCSGDGKDSGGAAGDVYTTVFPETGIGLYLGNGCSAIDCRFAGAIWITFALSGTGASVIGCSTEVVNIACRLGWGPAGETPAIGCSVQSLQTEAINVSCDLYNAQACYVQGNYFSDNVGLPTPQAITDMTWSSGTVTVTTAAAHNLPVGATPLTVTVTSNFDPGTNSVPITGWWVEKKIITATKDPSIANRFSYPGSATDPGAFSGTISNITWSGGIATVTIGSVTTAIRVGSTITLSNVDASWGTSVTVLTSDTTHFTYGLAGTGTGDKIGNWSHVARWTYPTVADIRCRKVSDTVIIGNTIAQSTNWLASVDLDYDGEAQHKNNIMVGCPGATGGWNLPTTTCNLAGWQFVQCGAVVTTWNTAAAAIPSPHAHMVFADLPGQFSDPSNLYQDGPFEGQEYDITNGSGSDFDAIVTGGGSGHYRVRYDGMNWKRIG